MINLGAEEKQDFSEPEYKFPKFFTISGYMETQSNPEINDEYHSIIKPIEREITRKEMEMRIITKTTRNINISLTHFEDMEQSQKDLKTLVELRDSLKKPDYFMRLVSTSSPSEVVNHIITDNTKDLATNISNFIEIHQEYRVTPIYKNGFMLQRNKN